MTEQIDYYKEVTALIDEKDGFDWWRPTTGDYKIELLDDGIPFQSVFEGMPTNRIRYRIKVDNNKQYTWTITKSRTKTGLWGQICILAAKNNKAKGLTFTLYIKGEKKNRQYTIPEALELLKKGGSK